MSYYTTQGNHRGIPSNLISLTKLGSIATLGKVHGKLNSETTKQLFLFVTRLKSIPGILVVATVILDSNTI